MIDHRSYAVVKLKPKKNFFQALVSSLCCACGALLRVSGQDILGVVGRGSIGLAFHLLRTRNSLSGLYHRRPH